MHPQSTDYFNEKIFFQYFSEVFGVLHNMSKNNNDLSS
jgi:hypothetical protein